MAEVGLSPQLHRPRVSLWGNAFAESVRDESDGDLDG
jgi:hypothetical protein